MFVNEKKKELWLNTHQINKLIASEKKTFIMLIYYLIGASVYVLTKAHFPNDFY